MSADIDITAEQRMLLLDLLRRHIPGVEVWAYGSRVQQKAQRNSDLDLVAFPAPNQHRPVQELRDAIAESNVPFLVDLHIWDQLPESFQQTIRNRYVVLQKQSDCVDARTG